jgi:hypothetical protein
MLDRGRRGNCLVECYLYHFRRITYRITETGHASDMSVSEMRLSPRASYGALYAEP